MKDQSARLLCVDDDPEFLRVLQEHLTRGGFIVHTATNGVEALVEAKQWSPKAVILDLFMPRLGGLGTLHHIRSLDPGLVFILISGVPNAAETVTKAGVRVAAVFTKPVDPVDISKSLARAGVTPTKTQSAVSERSPEALSRACNRVLVVDDEEDFREVVVEYLRETGFDTLEAQSGHEALRCIPDFRPHIVLLDIRMPGLDGIETLRQIKAMPQKNCVVMISANEDAEQARQTLAMGASDYVCKPVDFGYLDSVLETQLLTAELDPESQ